MYGKFLIENIDVQRLAKLITACLRKLQKYHSCNLSKFSFYMTINFLQLLVVSS